MKKLILIIGATGSGKTTDAELIAKANSTISHYSTGDMLRNEVASGSELGKEIENYISKGLIVPINIAITTITNAIKSAPTDVVLLDGYPRSIQQMEALEAFLQEDNTVELINVIEVAVSEETARDRVLGRSRGADDNSEVFDNRMRIYLEPLNAIQSFYKQQNRLSVISGEGTINEIVAQMQQLIDSKL